jgi:threonine dehydrogenase-like Zn-dependent dehydrogenase
MNVFSGLNKGTLVELDTNKIHYWGLKVLGSTGSSVQDYARALRLAETGQIRVRDVVSHRFGMMDSVSAFDQALSGNGMKTIIYPQEERL